MPLPKLHAGASLRDNRERQDIAVAHEARHFEIRRLSIDALWCTDLLHYAQFHYHDAIGERQRFILIVSHIDRGATLLTVNATNLRAHFQAQLGIEIGKRLVHEH
jgi:hypothetical protein